MQVNITAYNFKCFSSSFFLLLFIKLFLYISSDLRVVWLWRKGTTSVHVELEECVAKYVGKHSAIVFGMGYATNSFIIPVLIGKVCACIHIQSQWVMTSDLRFIYIYANMLKYDPVHSSVCCILLAKTINL